MKTILASIASLIIVLASDSAHAATRPTKHQIVAPSAIAPGQRVGLQLVPPVPGIGGAPAPRTAAPASRMPEFRYAWQVVSGPGSVSLEGIYAAPYIVEPNDSVAVIEVLGKNPKGGLDTLAVSELKLLPGVYPGADSCLGSGQTYEEDGLEFGELDDLPEAITTVPAEYPPAARARKIEGTLIVRTIVCRSGQVLDGYAVWPPGAVPDPILEGAALDAAGQFVFKPGTKAGRPMAAIVDIPFVFKP